MIRTIAVFDFDGTLTKKDTLKEFIKFSNGIFAYYISLLILSPVLTLYLLKIISNEKAKEVLFSYHFKNMPLLKFELLCQSFSSVINKMIRLDSFDKLLKHKKNKDEILIISASIENWILPWAISNGVYTVLGTQIEIINSHLTGKFSSPNCYGQEKVNRLNFFLGEINRSEFYIYAYGNTGGDQALLNWANIGIRV